MNKKNKEDLKNFPNLFPKIELNKINVYKKEKLDLVLYIS